MNARARSRLERTMGIFKLSRVRNWIISYHRSEFQETIHVIPESFGDTNIQRGMDDFSLILGLGDCIGLWISANVRTHTHTLSIKTTISVIPDIVDKCLSFSIACPLPLRRIQKGLLICPVRENTLDPPPFCLSRLRKHSSPWLLFSTSWTQGRGENVSRTLINPCIWPPVQRWRPSSKKESFDCVRIILRQGMKAAEACGHPL